MTGCPAPVWLTVAGSAPKEGSPTCQEYAPPRGCVCLCACMVAMHACLAAAIMQSTRLPSGCAGSAVEPTFLAHPTHLGIETKHSQHGALQQALLHTRRRRCGRDVQGARQPEVNKPRLDLVLAAALACLLWSTDMPARQALEASPRGSPPPCVRAPGTACHAAVRRRSPQCGRVYSSDLGLSLNSWFCRGGRHGRLRRCTPQQPACTQRRLWTPRVRAAGQLPPPPHSCWRPNCGPTPTHPEL